MASIFNVEGVGVQETPVSHYMAGISELFPRPNKTRLLESSVANRLELDVLPTNLGFNMKLSDRYVDFTIPGTPGSFIDPGKLVICTRLRFTTSDGVTALGADAKVDAVNNTAHSIFKSVQVFLGDVAVETNLMYGYTSYLKSLCTFSAEKMAATGALANLRKESNEGGLINEAYFNEAVVARSGEFKARGLSLAAPLFLDVSSMDSYLLDGIPIRLRLELANNSWVLLQPGEQEKSQYHVDSIKLLYSRIFPYPNALQALNQALAQGQLIKSTFTKTLYKTYVLTRDQLSATYDQPWGDVIPEKLIIFMTSMEAHAGKYTTNPLYLGAGKLNEVKISVNGRNICSVACNFPYNCSEIYYRTLESLGLHRDHCLNLELFKKGGFAFCLDLRAENLNETIPVEMTGGLRLHLSFSEAAGTNNTLIHLLGETTGIISVNNNRRLQCDVRA